MAIEIRQAATDAERARIFAFRYDIHFRELGKDGPGVDHAGARVVDDADEHATLLYAVDEADKIVGTGRTWFGSDAPLCESLRRTYDTSALEDAIGADKVSATGRLMVDPNYRGRTLTSLLVTRLYELALERGIEVDFCMCAIPLLRLYERLGYRAYRSNIRPDGLNLRVPLAICVNDRAYLGQVRSPFLRYCDSGVDDEGRTAKLLAARYGKFDSAPPIAGEDLRTLWAELATGLSDSARPKPRLLDGLSPDETQMIFKRAAVHKFLRGELIQLKDEQRVGMGVILKGRIGAGLPVDAGHHWLELFGPGDVFGEAAPVASTRSVDLVAMEDCHAALLPEDIVDRLESKDPALAMRVARNLVAVLRRRVDDLHLMTAEHLRRAAA